MRLLMLVAMMLISVAAAAANTPCSGKKGGIERCVGEQFLCRDGSISASKRSCSVSDAGAASLATKPAAASGNGTCNCRDGFFCRPPSRCSPYPLSTLSASARSKPAPSPCHALPCMQASVDGCNAARRSSIARALRVCEK